MTDHADYLRRCYELAAQSPDPSNQNGAIVAVDGYVAGSGVNRPPRGITYTRKQLNDREWRMLHFEHAERAALFSAAKLGVVIEGATLYCPWCPCAECARAIAMTGIARVVCHGERMDKTPERWKASVRAGVEILRAAGVAFNVCSGKLDAAPVLVNGELWKL